MTFEEEIDVILGIRRENINSNIKIDCSELEELLRSVIERNGDGLHWIEGHYSLVKQGDGVYKVCSDRINFYPLN